MVCLFREVAVFTYDLHIVRVAVCIERTALEFLVAHQACQTYRIGKALVGIPFLRVNKLVRPPYVAIGTVRLIEVVLLVNFNALIHALSGTSGSPLAHKGLSVTTSDAAIFTIIVRRPLNRVANLLMGIQFAYVGTQHARNPS